jgi:hypothetical protein
MGFFAFGTGGIDIIKFQTVYIEFLDTNHRGRRTQKEMIIAFCTGDLEIIDPSMFQTELNLPCTEETIGRNDIIRYTSQAFITN